MPFSAINCDICEKQIGWTDATAGDMNGDIVCDECFQKRIQTRRQSGIGYTFSPLVGKVIEIPLFENTEYTFGAGGLVLDAREKIVVPKKGE